MNIPLITWLCIALAMILIVIVRVFLSAHDRQMNKQHQHVSNTPHRRLFEIGNERGEFFVPGDRLPDSIDYYGDDDN